MLVQQPTRLRELWHQNIAAKPARPITSSLLIMTDFDILTASVMLPNAKLFPAFLSVFHKIYRLREYPKVLSYPLPSPFWNSGADTGPRCILEATVLHVGC